MARTVTAIKEQLTGVFISNDTVKQLYGLADGKTFSEQFSILSLESIIFYAIAFAISVLENIMDGLVVDVNNTIAEQKPHTTRWYALKAKAYQHGFDLLPDSDKYNNTGKTGEQIEASKVVKYSAVIETTTNSGVIGLRIKLAASNSRDLFPLSPEQLTGVREYFKRVKDAGVIVKVDSLPPDLLTMSWTVYYDPLILNAQGGRLDGLDSEPVQKAIREYLQSLPFNGIFVLQYIADAVEALPGVVICKINAATATYGGLIATNIDTMYLPDAGYLRFANATDLTIKFIPQSVIK
ncbi:hypothetical protein KTO58_19715 [Chitinophaga pendula]|uniref:hypothetical protein n=1 Tax=Chitinophaga TaxID=79328 RepID=UPI000BAE79CA|nr:MULTISPECIES: hypothetical protein [Chitinophaga]ASZ11104.1 hypothetical protein CK934_09085 [Chitinophaga sp. MD30]UCJ05898.1 hypothetical protein KTO58_19715 [Chitinophaga pendula]